MAGLFRAPKPVVVPSEPIALPPQQIGQDPATAQAAETARGENRARNGLNSTIATSARGVLAPLPLALTRKSLLGE